MKQPPPNSKSIPSFWLRIALINSEFEINRTIVCSYTYRYRYRLGFISMGTRTIGSHGKSDGLTKQGSLLYNLTLDEVQNQLGDLGKPLTSMNLDELLKSVWTAETEAAANQGGSDHPRNTQLASSSSIATLSKKTVDELWQDIQLKKNDNNSSSGTGGHNLDKTISTSREKQLTLGEMTLEDFLAKAGIVAKSSNEKKDSDTIVGEELIALPQQNINAQQAPWMQYQIPPFKQQQQQHVFMPGHHQVQQPLMDAAYPETQMIMSPTPLMATLSDTQTPGWKRLASGDVIEKTVERRQKRMIKNRESAARSRARKQAYTQELENKVSRLEEENERLKREQEAEKALPCVPSPEPKYQLRRTSSALF